ncbi:MAG: DUF4389 domain-containing protein [Proteobacteria bacterium]|nr:DUF4389 domain-containing protein [Pseudomonadota bacterium]
MESTTRENMTRKSLWVRALYMLLFTVILGFAKTIVGLSVIFQFLTILFTGRSNEPVLQFGNNMSVYLGDVYRYLTFNAERLPFPFSDWPDEEIGEDRWMSENELEEVHETSAFSSEREAFRARYDDEIGEADFQDTSIDDRNVDEEVDDSGSDEPREPPRA